MRPAAPPHPCAADGCDRTARMRAPFCNMHRQRFRKHGDPLHERFAPAVERLLSRTDPVVGSCWLWTGSLSQGTGYGQFWMNGHNTLAHRSAYQLLVGPIPDGLDLDHLCRNKACINPAHLEPVTAAVNTQRYHASRKEIAA